MKAFTVISGFLSLFLNLGIAVSTYAQTPAELAASINAGDFKPKTCVASLLKNPKSNERIYGEILDAIRSLIGRREPAFTQPEALVVFKANGPRGISECLQGDYEDVTILSQSAPLLFGPALVYGDEESGPYFAEVVPSQIFRAFLKDGGHLKINSEVRQITLISCQAEAFVEKNWAFRQLLSENGLRLKLQPSDWLPSEMLHLEIRTESLFGITVAENAQPADMNRLFCLVPTHLVGVWEHGSTNDCVRGKYSIRVRSPAIGFKRANKLISFAPDHGHFKFSLFDIEIGFRYGLDLHTTFSRSLLMEHQSYGFSLGLGEWARITENQ